MAVELTGGNRVTFSYDPDGLRQRREDSSGSVDALWDGENLLAEIAGGGTQASYAAGLDKFGPLVSQRRSGTSRFYLADELGTVHGLLDSSQSLTDSYVFGAFGDPVSSSGSTTNPHRFVGGLGYYEDPDLDLTYVRARWYRPSTGTWLSVDPIPGEPPFSYVGHAPTFRTDPSDESWWWWFWFVYVLAKMVCILTYLDKGKHDKPNFHGVDIEYHRWAYCMATAKCSVDGLGDWVYCMTEWTQHACRALGLNFCSGQWQAHDIAANKAGGAIGKWVRQGLSYDCRSCCSGATIRQQGSSRSWIYTANCHNKRSIGVAQPRC